MPSFSSHSSSRKPQLLSFDPSDEEEDEKEKDHKKNSSNHKKGGSSVDEKIPHDLKNNKVSGKHTKENNALAKRPHNNSIDNHTSAEKSKFMKMSEMTEAKFIQEQHGESQRRRQQRLLQQQEGLLVASMTLRNKTEVVDDKDNTFDLESASENEVESGKNRETATETVLKKKEVVVERRTFDGVLGSPFTLTCGCFDTVGRREKMEDTRICSVDFYRNASLYAVFDGHNGSKLASFCRNRYPALLDEILKANEIIDGDRHLNCVDFSDSGPVGVSLSESLRQIDAEYDQLNPGAKDGSTALVALIIWSRTKEQKEEQQQQTNPQQPQLNNLTCKDDDSSTTESLSSYNEYKRQQKIKLQQQNYSRTAKRTDDDVSINNKRINGRMGTSYMFLAHLGDSRAILVANEIPTSDTSIQKDVPAGDQSGENQKDEEVVSYLRLTEDHKPNRPEELKRIENCGGFVVGLGCHRVSYGNTGLFLAVSRCLGDYLFKKIHRDLLSNTADIGHRELEQYQDTYLVMASDGLWDVLSDKFVADFVTEKCKKYVWQKELENKQMYNYNWDKISRKEICVLPRKDDLNSTRSKSIVHHAYHRFICQSILDNVARALSMEAIAQGSMDNITTLIISFNWRKGICTKI